jgi:aminopeptidase N
MKPFLFSCLFLFLLLNKTYANVSDTIHISHYNISIDTINYSTHTIRGVTELSVQSRINGVSHITLGLLQLTADSIIAQSSSLAFTTNDTLMHITLPVVLNTNDSITLRVYYHGIPVTDGGFGGFYFSGTYAYNIGVGLNIQPHNMGKAWFPCVDEFTDRATYEFHITTPSTYKAFCNGILQDSIDNGNSTITWNWQINQTIPTYLAAVAVAPFYTVRRTYQGIPVQFAILSTDSNRTITYFQHLDSVLANYIRSYGPYPFDKVGYSMVPFNGGAMEHATSIHLGTPFVTTNLAYEYIWAHELSHMWFGDKVTCDRAEEMWLNEGWAAYNENVYKSYIYGEAVYDSLIHLLHMKVVQFNHIQDNGYYALKNVPQSYTYAHTVYDKGAVAVSKIRNYMGDSAFFQGVKDYLNNRAWTAVSSLDLRDELQNSSGINMTDYFNTIIATPGFPQVSIDSFVVTPNGGNYDVTLYTREKQKGNSLTFSLPVDFTFSDRTHDNTIQFIVNAPTNSFSATLPFIPQWTAADRYGKLLSATLAYERTISDTGTYTFPDTYSSVHVLNPGVDTSIIRIEHNYVKPDDFIINPGGVRLSDYRYYKVDGLFSSGMQAHATFTYDGSANPTSGYLDNTLFSGSATEDSLLIFYRSNSGENWQLVNGYSINFVVLHTDKKGMITVDTLKRGEYVLGVRDFTSGIFNAVSKPGNNLEVSPNPSNGLCHISFHLSSYKGLIEVADAAGKKIYSTEVFSHQQNIDWDSYHVQSGIYFVQLIESGKVTGQQKVLVQKK